MSTDPVTADEPMSTPDSGGLREAVEALAVEFARRQSRNAAHNGNVSCSVWGIAGSEVGRLLAAHPADLPYQCLSGPNCPDSRCAAHPEPVLTPEDDLPCSECPDYCHAAYPATPPADDANRAPVSGGLDEGEREALADLVWPTNYADPDLEAICEFVERIVAARDAAWVERLAAVERERDAAERFFSNATENVAKYHARAEAAEAERDTARREKADAWWSGHLHGCEDTGRLKADGHREMHDADNPFRARADALTSDDGSGA